MTLGEFIKRKREEVGMSIADLREATGAKTWHGAASWERGVAPKTGTLLKIAAALGMGEADKRELLALAARAAAEQAKPGAKVRLIPDRPDALRGEPVVLRPPPPPEPAERRAPDSTSVDFDRLVGRAFRDLEHLDVLGSDSAKLLEAMKPAAGELGSYDAAEAYAIVTLWAETAIELREEGRAINAQVIAARSARKMLERHAANDTQTGTFRKLPPGQPVPDDGETEAKIAAAKVGGRKAKAK